MILMKIDDNGELDVDLDMISMMVEKYAEGDRSQPALEAHIFSLIYDFGYESAVMDFEEARDQALLMISGTGGTA